MKNIVTLACFLFFVMNVFAQQPQAGLKPGSSGSETKANTDTSKTPKKPSLADKVKGLKKYDGYFTLYQDTVTGSVQFYVNKSQLNKEIIYQSYSVSGLTDFYLNQSMHRANFNFQIKKSFDKLEFSTMNYSFYYDPESPLSKSKDVDRPESIFFADKFSFEDENGFLINVDGLFLSEKMDAVRPLFPPGLPPGLVFNMGSLNTVKSKYNKIRSYPNNTDVVVDLAYENPAPFNSGGKDVTDPRYVRIRMQHSFVEMPLNDYRPRRDDPRVGFFANQVDNLTSTSVTPYKDYIRRWYLKKKDPTAAISEPVEPIVWWVENRTPLEYRQAVIDAGNMWNIAFEKAGFKNAIVMKQMPDDADWEPEDIRYNVIRWVSSSDPPYGAIGPHFANSKTGQILGSDISFEWSAVSSTFGNNDFFETLGMANSPEKINEITNKLFSQEHQHCFATEEIRAQLQSAIAITEVRGYSEEEVKEVKKQLIYWMVMHEMGHTLGLWHNMISSQLLSPADLNNKEITRKTGLIGSVMDYPSINIAPDKNKQGDYFTTTVGPYDIWAIQYGYTPFDPSEEEVGLNKILAKSTEPGHAFANDPDDMRAPGKAIDPRVMTFDLSNDAIQFAEDRLKIVNSIIPKLKNKYAKPGESYAKLRAMYGFVTSQRSSMGATVSRYVGGVYVERNFVGQQTAVKPFTPVPVTTQKKAIQILAKYYFTPDAFATEEQLYPYLKQQRRGGNFGGTTEDIKPLNIYQNIQNNILAHILHPTTMLRISNSSLYGNTYSVADVLNDLTVAIFDADQAGNVNLMRQNLQINFTKSLINIFNSPDQSYDNLTRSAVYATLLKIKAKAQRLTVANELTKAHRSTLVYLVNKGLKTN